MKFLTILFLAVLFSNNINAQDVSYWVGQSANPDPIMRHHEAFMDAFVKYIQNRPKETNGEVITNNAEEVAEGINKSLAQDGNNETCRIETVSSVTYEGRETVTISIGNGPLVHYQGLTVSSSTDDVILTKTILSITYQEEPNRIDTKSVHEYRIEEFTQKGSSATARQFSYQCTSINKHE